MIKIADVVFLIESTAHLSPYVESLKTNYIIPTIEYFNNENNYQSTLYGIVTFMSMDCKPDSATMCYAPTFNTQVFLRWLDKIQFIGGAGDSSSHIVEGLCTALNLFEDFQNLRESNSNDTLDSTIKLSKYCILICNSTPYQEPALESFTYNGFTMNQLMNMIAGKNINFNVFSPRKMSFLYKLFENSGGDLMKALSKNYAKDRRHLVLLNGFHLQEKPLSPVSQPNSLEQSEQVHKGIKRSLSPSSSVPQVNPQINQQQQIISKNQQINVVQSNSNETQQQFSMPHSKIPDNLIMQARVGSPTVNHWTNNANVPSPSQAPPQRHQTVRSRAPTPQIAPNANINLLSSVQQNSNLVSQVNLQHQSSATTMVRSVNPVMRAQPQSSFPTSQAPSPSQQQQPSPMLAVPSPLQNNSPLSQNQQFLQQQQINQMSQVANIGKMNQMQANLTQVPRTKIWNGIIEYAEKTQQQSLNTLKTVYSLDCYITYQSNQSDPEFTAERWPEKLTLYTVPKNLVNRLSPILKNSSYHINLHFTPDSQGFALLCKTMSNNQVGCIQMPNLANIRIIIVFYMPDKKIFVGFIPHHQDEFMNSMKELIETHKKEQQAKQIKFIQQQQQRQQPQQMQQQGQVLTNIPSNPSMAAAGQLASNLGVGSGQTPIQIRPHGTMNQTGSINNNPTLMSTNNSNNMFQLQISTMANNGNTMNNITQSSNQQVSLQPNSNNTSSNMMTQQNMMNIANQKNFTNNSNSSMVQSSNAPSIQVINPLQTNMNLLQTSNAGVGQNIVNPQMMQQNNQQNFNISNVNQMNINNQNQMNTNRTYDPNMMVSKQLDQQQTINTLETQGQIMQIQQPQNVVRQQLHQQIQQKQIHQQQQQHQTLNSNHNPQLKHLLQQQQMRTMASRMNLQQQQTGLVQQQPQNMLSQQFRFSTMINQQQQLNPQAPSQSFDDY